MSGKTPAIGDPIWHFNENRRRYTTPAKKGGFGELIWREHWEQLTITGETRVSLVACIPDHPWDQFKIAKKDLRDGKLRGLWALSEAEVDDQAWVMEHRYRISDAVNRMRDRAVLEQVAVLAGYEPKKP